MHDHPNPELFSRDDRPREYRVVLSVTGTIRRIIEADNLEEAQAKARQLADEIKDDAGLCDMLDEIERVRIDLVRKALPVYRVLRDGEPWQVTHLKETDIPREPDERGF